MKWTALPVTDKRELVQLGHAQVSVRRQCEWVGLARSNWYYEPAEVSVEELVLQPP